MPKPNGGSVGKESTCNEGDLDVIPLGWEDPLEKGMATHSSILAWRIPWIVESIELQRVEHNRATFTFTGERHGNPLQYSCLENPMYREA